jgi:hypothetical protein
MDEKNAVPTKKAIKKSDLQKKLSGVTDDLFKRTVWDVMSEFRKKDIVDIKQKQCVLPKEAEEIMKRLQFD